MRRLFDFTVCVAAVCSLFVGLFGCGETNVGGAPIPIDVDGVYDWHTDVQNEYLSASDFGTVPQGVKGTEELSRPRPLTLEWTHDGESASYTVDISRSGDFTDSVSFTTAKRSIGVYNLFAGSAYAWRVTANGKDGKSVSRTSYFMTSDKTPRNIYVDGVTNVRDLGGYATGEGRVRQGMLYRCGRLNKSRQANVEIEITARGIATMKDELRVKSEVDFRQPSVNNETGGITSSPLGDGVAYFNIPMEFDQPDPLIGNADAVVDMFELLADAYNYPIIFHCDIGTDRTGMLAFLINGLLGVSETELYRDYMFSNFAKIGGSRSVSTIKSKYVDKIKAYNGDTLAQKIDNYLVDKVGVSQSDIDAMCDIMQERAD